MDCIIITGVTAAAITVAGSTASRIHAGVVVKGLSFPAKDERLFYVPLELFRVSLKVKCHLILPLKDAR